MANSEQAIKVPVEAIVHRLRKELADDIIASYDKQQEALELSERAREAQYIKVIYTMKDEKARIHLIKTGIADSKRVELVEGLELDETVNTGPYRSLDQLRDGKKVALIEEEKKEGEKKAEQEDEEEQQAAQKAPDPDDDSSESNG